MPPVCLFPFTLPLFIQFVMVISCDTLFVVEPIIPPTFVFDCDFTTPWFSQLVIVPPPEVEAICPQMPPILSEFEVTFP